MKVHKFKYCVTAYISCTCSFQNVINSRIYAVVSCINQTLILTDYVSLLNVSLLNKVDVYNIIMPVEVTVIIIMYLR